MMTEIVMELGGLKHLQVTNKKRETTFNPTLNYCFITYKC